MSSIRIPSTKELRAFEATARLGSIKAAAVHLHVTASAISRRIQSLEEELGQSLFVRDVQGLTLTESGAYYAKQLQTIFQSLEQATNTIRHQSKQRLVVLAHSMVAQGIMVHLDDFEVNLPDVELALHTFLGIPGSDPAIANADVVFSWGDDEWEGWDSILLTPRSHLVPVCVPGLLASGMPFSDEELSEHTWITVKHFERGWKHWYEQLGIVMPVPRRVLEMSTQVMAREAAKLGRGIMMGYGFGGYPDFDILAGHFLPAHAFHAMAPTFGIRMHIRRNAVNPAIPRFRQWFFEKVWLKRAMEQWLSFRK